jgi:hypothetical protein
MYDDTWYHVAYIAHASTTVRLPCQDVLVARMLQRLLDMAELGTIEGTVR